MGALGVTGPGARRAAVILDELCANMIRHDPSLGPAKRFRIELTGRPGHVAMVVADPGRPFDPLTFEVDPKAEGGGHGLALIRAMAGSVAYARAGGENRLTVRLRAR